jgi:glucose-6-phosphate isomerase
MLFAQDIEASFQDKIGAAGVPRPRYNAWLERTRPILADLKRDRASGKLALLRLPDETEDLKAAEPVAEALLKNTSDLAILGVGGSSLGAQVLAQLSGRMTPGYRGKEGEPRLHFFDNLDGETFAHALQTFDLRSARFLVVSKSGTTGETVMQMLAALKALEDAGGGKYLKHHFALISERGESNPLRKLATEIGCPILDHPTVGGRYSVLSVVGLLPARLVGLDPAAVRAGAREVITALDAGDPKALAAAQGAALLSAMMEEQNLRQIVLWPYGDRFERFALWWRQLWGESIGKNGKGSTPIPAIGPVDQHSQLQLFIDGPNDKHFTFLNAPVAGTGPRTSETWAKKLGQDYLSGHAIGDLVTAQMRATPETLIKHGRPVRSMRVQTFDERTLGALFMHFMLETIIACRLLGVDPFDQPAVEEGKVLARKYLAEAKS